MYRYVLPAQFKKCKVITHMIGCSMNVISKQSSVRSKCCQLQAHFNNDPAVKPLLQSVQEHWSHCKKCKYVCAVKILVNFYCHTMH